MFLSVTKTHRQLKRHVDVNTNTMKLLIPFILSRLDYCNVLLSGIPMSTIRPLQRVQNAAARLALGLSPGDYVSAALKKLHWLPVTYRIQYKLALMMYQLGDRAFSIAGLKAWNNLPQSVRSADSLDSF